MGYILDGYNQAFASSELLNTYNQTATHACM